MNEQQAISSGYLKIDERTLAGSRATAWLSSKVEDARWDSFLMGTPQGQFQQSTIWARAKHTEGWTPVRVLITLNGEIVGGFQVLKKSSWWGGIGYVSKGPVCVPDRPEVAGYAAELLATVSRRERLRAVVVQPPDSCGAMVSQLLPSGVLPNVLTSVIETTWIVDLRGGLEPVEQAIDKNTRKKLRQAERRGITIREGGRTDLSTFFNLMESSCRRQRTKPNPSDVEFLFGLWDAAKPIGCIKLFIAEHDAGPVGGLLCVPFGRNASAWKKGWNASDGYRRPNELLTYESLKWAAQEGYDFIDFMAFDDRSALAILRGEPIPVEGQASRHFFNSRFGGHPRILPAAVIYIPNPIVRLAYKASFCRKIRSTRVHRRALDEARVVAQRES